MRQLLLLLGLILAGAVPCKSQDTLVLKDRQTIEGRVAWDRSRGDSLYYFTPIAEGDSLLLFVPRRKVEYVMRSDESRMMYRGRNRGWQPWRGRTFNERPQHRMLYGVSGGIISAGLAAEVSAMRVLNRNQHVGIGAFVRYLSTEPVRKAYPVDDTYKHQALAFGPQAQIRGYSRRLKTFFYLNFALGGAYHRFDWGSLRRDAYYDWIESRGPLSKDYMAWLRNQYPSSMWSYLFDYKLGFYTRLTRGLYADVAFVGMGYIIDRLPRKYISSDQFPYGLSVGLRFGCERR